MSHCPASLDATEDDIAKMLSCQVHVGTKNVESTMTRYVFKRRQDGIHIIDLRKTWEKLVFAARVIVAVENPADVCVLTARPWGQRAVLKFSKYVGATPIAGRFTPGTFTNRIEKNFSEPRLLVVCDPFTDAQPIRESSYVNVPTIAFCHTDSPTRHIDVVIPANNKSKHAIAIMWYFLAREVLRIRNPASDRTAQWEVMPDMFIFRDPEEQEKQEAEQLAIGASSATPFAPEEYAGQSATPFAAGGDATSGDWAGGNAGDATWDGAAGPSQEWGAPSGEWGNDGAAVPPPAAAAAAATTPGGQWSNQVVGAGWDK